MWGQSTKQCLVFHGESKIRPWKTLCSVTWGRRRDKCQMSHSNIEFKAPNSKHIDAESKMAVTKTWGQGQGELGHNGDRTHDLS